MGKLTIKLRTGLEYIDFPHLPGRSKDYMTAKRILAARLRREDKLAMRIRGGPYGYERKRTQKVGTSIRKTRKAVVPDSGHVGGGPGEVAGSADRT